MPEITIFLRFIYQKSSVAATATQNPLKLWVMYVGIISCDIATNHYYVFMYLCLCIARTQGCDIWC